MATHIIEEIEAGGDVYTLHGKAMVNSNNTNSTTPYVYDWGGYSVYTKTETDAIVVHKTGDEIISGCKSFSGGDNVSAVGTAPINIVDINPDGTTAGTLQYKDIVFGDTNNIRIGVVRAGGITISCAADGTDVRCNLPTETYGTNFHGTSTSAKWADLAEMYESDKTYSKGFVLDAGKENSLPVALCGKTPIRIIGKVKRFDNITLSETSGVGRIALDGEKVIGKCLEASDVEEEKLVIQIQVGSEVYDIQADSVENQNHATGALSDKFDWIGTQSEYIDQDIENQHPDWFCYITDDVTTDSGEIDLSNYAKTSEVSSAINTLLSTLYPVGSLYIGTQTTCPLETLIPGSTWAKVAGDKVLQTSSSSHNPNTTIEAGLPNITGYLSTGFVQAQSAEGAFSIRLPKLNRNMPSGSDTYQSGWGWDFNAANSSSIYGSSSTVQPPAYVVNVWRRTA
ncbi:unnamed protein product [Cylicocyclus nassatus]|uniref:Uncharacterized protein n=1 Tax=Cylicocyclus nassatus TaxID=53992 RepID=A0AA36DRC4_CYLNA|nr:unnamed protein product [Cylicocyclus nassatus]